VVGLTPPSMHAFSVRVPSLNLALNPGHVTLFPERPSPVRVAGEAYFCFSLGVVLETAA
jgi:hypothetical protein